MRLFLPFRLPARLRCFYLSLISCLLVHAVARASGEKISAIDPSNNPISTTQLGYINPCGGVHFQLTAYTPPFGVAISSISWYGNGVLQVTSSGGNPYETVLVTSNDGGGHFNVYCVVHYGDGSSGTSNNYTVNISDMNLSTPTQGAPAVLNCPSSISFSTNFQSITYVPTPADVSSFTWSLPSNWSVSSTSGGSVNGNSYSIANVSTDAMTAGNVSATVTLSCGYTRTSPILAVSRTTPATAPPYFSGLVCAGGIVNGAINPICGPMSYTWSVPGNSGLTFSSNGSQILTTTGTTVSLSTSSSAPSGDVPVSVVANYPGGLSSSTVSGTLHVGVPTNPYQIYGMNQGANLCEGSSFNVYTLGQPAGETFVWSVSFLQSSANGLASGQGTSNAVIQLPSGYTYSNSGDVVDGWLVLLQSQNACGISNWQTSLAGNVTGCAGGGISSSIGRKTLPGSATGLKANSSLQVFPNPAGSVVNISLPDSVNASTASITLSDIYGRQLKRIVTVSSLNRISLSGLASGVYLVEIFDGRKLLSVQKIVKK